MFNADLYAQTNAVAKNHAKIIVDKYFHLLKWHDSENILDVGSGDGGTLMDSVWPKFPKNFKELTLLDIDENMLKLSRNTFENNPKVNFCCMDITSKPTPSKFIENFDHIFSFYCLQYVKDQREVMKILFDMLKPGGEIFLTIIAKHMVFEVYRELEKFDKWKPYMLGVRDIAPYLDSDDPVKDAEVYLKNAGFEHYKCELIDLQHTFQYSDFLRFAESVDIFFSNIPKQEIKQYREDYLNELKKNQMAKIEYRNGKEESVCLYYNTLVVYASKTA